MDLTEKVTIDQLATFLLDKFPVQDAEEWDNVGLIRGDGDSALTGIAIALNATPASVDAAAKAECNVLVTHHPPFLGEYPERPPHDAPILDVSLAQGTLAKAEELNIALIVLHTNLDVSHEAMQLPAELTDYEYAGRLILPTDCTCPSHYQGETVLQGCYGSILNTKNDSADNIATLFAQSFHCRARILGKDGRNLKEYVPGNVVFCPGSLDESLGKAALKRGIDIIVCGEAHYHTALELVLAGATLIELGHDASEEPYIGLLEHIISGAFSHLKIVCIETKPLLMSVK